MINRTQNTPLYLQIKNALLKMIENMEIDQKLPGELELANEYGVSRGTVKQAIMDLVHEGTLYRIQGKGTFVAPIKIKRSFGTLPTFTDDIRRLGYVPDIKVIAFESIQTPNYIAAKLQIPEESNIIRFERLVLASDKPVALVTSYLRLDIYPNLLNLEIDSSLYRTLERYFQKAPTSANDTYSAQNANSKVANLLGIKPGKAIFYSERVAYLDNQLPVEYVESYFRSDRFTLDIHVTQNSEISKGEDELATYYGFRFGNNGH